MYRSMKDKHNLFFAALSSVLVLTGCGDDNPTSRFDQFDSDNQSEINSTLGLANAKAFLSDSPYADVLVPCASATRFVESCRLEILPLIGNDHSEPTIDDIMTRVVVSHDWMAENFRAALEVLPSDILSLLKSVTAIVIDDDINPSFINPSSGALHLDATYLWTSNSHKTDIPRFDRLNTDFASELNFVSLSRYVKDNKYAFVTNSVKSDSERTIDEMALNLARVLYHELAHANDALNVDEVATLSPSLSIEAARIALSDNTTSIALNEFSPLRSNVWYGLSDVIFFGDSASTKEQEYSARQVGLLFEDDLASDVSAYASIYEDTAMLFEESMMAFHFGLQRDIAFTTLSKKIYADCSDYVVQWGVRGRVGDENVKARAQYVVNSLLGSSDAITSFFDELPAPKYMARDVDWCDNIDLAETIEEETVVEGEARLVDDLSDAKVRQENIHL